MKIIVKIVILALVVMGLPRFIQGIDVSGFYCAFLAALAIGAVNLFIKPLISLITLPVNVLTLGLFGLLVNGGLLWLVAYYLPGFSITGFVPAFIGGIIVAFINWLVSKF